MTGPPTTAARLRRIVAANASDVTATLTIIANALRVGDHIAARLGA